MCEGAGTRGSKWEGGVGRGGSGPRGGQAGWGLGERAGGPTPHPAALSCRSGPEATKGREGEAADRAPGLWAGQEDVPGQQGRRKQCVLSGGPGPADLWVPQPGASRTERPECRAGPLGAAQAPKWQPEVKGEGSGRGGRGAGVRPAFCR